MTTKAEERTAEAIGEDIGEDIEVRQRARTRAGTPAGVTHPAGATHSHSVCGGGLFLVNSPRKLAASGM